MEVSGLCSLVFFKEWTWLFEPGRALLFTRVIPASRRTEIHLPVGVEEAKKFRCCVPFLYLFD